MRNGSEHDVRQMRHGSIKESRPDLYAQLVNKKNGRLTLGAREMVEWSCDECGKTYRATVYSRTLLGTGHQDCARKHVGEKNKIPAIGESLLDKFPEVAAQMVDADPSKVKPFSRDLYNWKCKGCSRVRRFTPSNFIANKSFYCRKCRPGGHDETGASFVYLMHRPGQIQYGIMNIWTDRLKTHARNGWSLLEKIEVTGQKARSLETKIKQTLRAKGVPTGRKAFRSPFDGSTEAFQEVDLSVRTIRELCDFLGINLDAFLAA
jgi:hypothetical protein